jgi:DNA-binding NarL/FixJ family response regulator
VSARPQLSAALAAFETLGAESWAARARNELRASGVAVNRPQDPEPVLTPQELQIAELAAAGMSNRQIGERLYLSPRTVGSHLYRIFPKLGISSRAALRQAIESLLPPNRVVEP